MSEVNKKNLTVIKAKNLGKDYKLYSRPSDRLSEILFNQYNKVFKLKAKELHKNFSALSNVSFSLNKGEVLGILGRNGSGKSTLLQLITGILHPTHGNIAVNGKVAALLELGSGLNPNFTGRENIFNLAAIQGLSKKETLKSIDKIIEFADIGAFIDEQVGKFSTGMIMRLAFAVNTILKPDILVIDEALAVGDIPFQAKCFQKLKELVKEGVTVVFVSHDISAVRSICNKSIWLKDGEIEMMGLAAEVADAYEKYCYKEQGVFYGNQKVNPNEDDAILEDGSSKKLSHLVNKKVSLDKNIFFKNKERVGSLDVEIKDFKIVNKHDDIINECEFNEEIKFIFHLKLNININDPFMIGLRIKDLKGNYYLSMNDYKNIHFLNDKKGSEYKVCFKTRLPLHHDTYSITVATFSLKNMELKNDYSNYDFTKALVWDHIDNAYFLTVKADIYPHAGPVQHFAEPEIDKIK